MGTACAKALRYDPAVVSGFLNIVALQILLPSEDQSACATQTSLEPCQNTSLPRSLNSPNSLQASVSSFVNGVIILPPGGGRGGNSEHITR